MPLGWRRETDCLWGTQRLIMGGGGWGAGETDKMGTSNMSIYSSYIWLSATGNIGSWHRGSNEEVLSQVPQKPRPWEWANSRLPAGVGSSALAAGTRARPSQTSTNATAPPTAATRGRSVPALRTASRLQGTPHH